MNQENQTGGLRCHDPDECVMGQLPCPTPEACGCAPPDRAVERKITMRPRIYAPGTARVVIEWSLGMDEPSITIENWAIDGKGTKKRGHIAAIHAACNLLLDEADRMSRPSFGVISPRNA